jgi:hypothetical protein
MAFQDQGQECLQPLSYDAETPEVLPAASVLVVVTCSLL